MRKTISIPMKFIGPLRITGSEINTEVHVPLATYEFPLWPSVNRGASVSRYCEEGIRAFVLRDHMTRSIILEADHASLLKNVVEDFNSRRAELEQVIASTSQYTQLKSFHIQIIGNLLYVRWEACTGEASGHNMLTKAADALITWLLKTYANLRYVSISGNFCTDKKVSAVNSLLGRGKYVVADILVPRLICRKRLKTTPEAIVNLHIKKNLIGSIVAGSLHSANAHFANMLLAFYLATGQDAANIVEGSQGITHTETRDGDLYFSVTLPNIIVGTLGSGKHLDFVEENIKGLGCHPTDRNTEKSARRLAIIIAATVLCGELSLLAAQTNPGELMRAHDAFERGNENYHEPTIKNRFTTVL